MTIGVNKRPDSLKPKVKPKGQKLLTERERFDKRKKIVGGMFRHG